MKTKLEKEASRLHSLAKRAFRKAGGTQIIPSFKKSRPEYRAIWLALAADQIAKGGE